MAGWWICGILAAIATPSDAPFLLHFIGYPLAWGLACLCVAYVFRGLYRGIKYLLEFFGFLAVVLLCICGYRFVEILPEIRHQTHIEHPIDTVSAARPGENQNSENVAEAKVWEAMPTDTPSTLQPYSSCL